MVLKLSLVIQDECRASIASLRKSTVHCELAGIGNVSHQNKTDQLVEHDFGLFCWCFTDVKTSMSHLVRVKGLNVLI